MRPLSLLSMDKQAATADGAAANTTKRSAARPHANVSLGRRAEGERPGRAVQTPSHRKQQQPKGASTKHERDARDTKHECDARDATVARVRTAPSVHRLRPRPGPDPSAPMRDTRPQQRGQRLPRWSPHPRRPPPLPSGPQKAPIPPRTSPPSAPRGERRLPREMPRRLRERAGGEETGEGHGR